MVPGDPVLHGVPGQGLVRHLGDYACMGAQRLAHERVKADPCALFSEAYESVRTIAARRKANKYELVKVDFINRLKNPGASA